MRANYVYEAIDFERGQNPKDALDIGRYRSDVTLDMDKSRGFVATPSAVPLEDPYDLRKFFQNLESGFYPSNLGILYYNRNGVLEYVYADNLKKSGFDNILYKGKRYFLG